MRDDFDVHGTQRIYVTRLGPLDVIVLGLLMALIAALTLIVLLGAVLFWIPAVVLLVAAAIVSKLLRRSSAEAGLARPSVETTDAARDERASQLVDRLSLWSGAAGLIPVPLVDIAAVGGVQLYMLRRLSEIYEIPIFRKSGQIDPYQPGGSDRPGERRNRYGQLPEGIAWHRNCDRGTDYAGSLRRRYLGDRQGFHSAFCFGWDAS